MITEPALALAAVRMTGGLSADAIAPSALEKARAAAADAGRALISLPFPASRSGTARAERNGLVLGWDAQATPSPEDSDAYPVRRLSLLGRLTWVCCLGLAWPDRAGPLYPGEVFTLDELIDLAADLGAPTIWVKASVSHDLLPGGLLASDGVTLRLGPAAAALPDAFVEALRRFHDRLPRRRAATGGARHGDLVEPDGLPADEGDHRAVQYPVVPGEEAAAGEGRG